MGFNITQIVNKMLPAKIEESAIALPVDIQGVSLVTPGESLPVTVVNTQSENPVEVITLVDAQSLRTTAPQTVNMPDLSKYISYDIFVVNQLNQAVRIAPWLNTSIVLEDDTIGRWSTEIFANDGLSYNFRIPARTNPLELGAYWLSELTPNSNNGGTVKPKMTNNWFKRISQAGEGKLSLMYGAGVSPTEGVFTIRIIGRLR